MTSAYEIIKIINEISYLINLRIPSFLSTNFYFLYFVRFSNFFEISNV